MYQAASFAMVLKLYGAPFSTCTKRVAMVCIEKQIPYEFVNVDLATGEHKTAVFKAIQPFAEVPYIVSPLIGRLHDVNTRR